MKIRNLLFTGLLSCGLAHGALAATELKHWPEPAAKQLDALIAANANKGAYAVFDMDNTSYRYDVAEALLPYLENKGVLTREKLDPALKLIPFKDAGKTRESLNSYYTRLCEFDHRVCYPWAAQALSGLTLGEVKGHLDAMMASGKPIKSDYYEGDTLHKVEVQPPQMFRGQQELFQRLMENGIEVYILTASHEELVRMVASDPQYGYNVKPENVIGVSTLLKDRKTGAVTTARRQISESKYDPDANRGLEFTAYLWTPGTWMAGKTAAIQTYIDPWKKPILVGGDSPSNDGHMLFHATAEDGVHLWVNRKAKYMDQLDGMIKQNAGAQAELKLPVSADKNWVVVTPEEIL
ncbi:haloacid dehalogenase-like hydrolase [Pseudomonas citronellolis]|uniref:haloacid dehalogenase-like hydrolase n=1 Tax=Pseudomonas citronellolis TaxID=53408 RepID=UPI0023E3A417|nr:haloacid dehalogenase-like hydrolase [Pseudomonas citronellolis]MDF3931306.1 haloacid dehalogenase-like hydrolase [Pseudomonas citronellolis]